MHGDFVIPASVCSVLGHVEENLLTTVKVDSVARMIAPPGITYACPALIGCPHIMNPESSVNPTALYNINIL